MVHDDDETVHAGRSVDMDFFGTLVTTPGQGSPGRRKLILWERFPLMTGLEISWLRIALKLYNSFRPTAKDVRAANREVSSSWAIQCILALSCKIDSMVTSAPDELSDPNLTPFPTHPGIRYVARSHCCHLSVSAPHHMLHLFPGSRPLDST